MNLNDDLETLAKHKGSTEWRISLARILKQICIQTGMDLEFEYDEKGDVKG